jgi:hypothetical protein
MAEKEKSFANKMADAGNNGKKKWKVLKEGLLLEKQSNSILEITNNNRYVHDIYYQTPSVLALEGYNSFA